MALRHSIKRLVKRVSTGRCQQGAGRQGEEAAARHLRRAGYRILGRNLRNRFGEVDLLAEAPDQRTIVVVEVKSSVPPGSGDDSSSARRPQVARGRSLALANLLRRALARPRDTDHGQPIASPVAPELRVGRRKQRQLVALACQLARRYRLTNRPIRFDVIGVDLPQGHQPVIRHHRGAFESHV